MVKSKGLVPVMILVFCFSISADNWNERRKEIANPPADTLYQRLLNVPADSLSVSEKFYMENQGKPQKLKAVDIRPVFGICEIILGAAGIISYIVDANGSEEINVPTASGTMRVTVEHKWTGWHTWGTVLSGTLFIGGFVTLSF